MRLAKLFPFLALMLVFAVMPVTAQTVINAPANGSTVSSTFTLNMYANSCSGQPVGAVGYSLDNSSQTSAWPDYQINGPVGAPSGWHTLHVKVWNVYGGVCVTDLNLNVTAGAASTNVSGGGGSYVVPSWATQNSGIQTLGNWLNEHDDGTPGNASGSMSMQNSPSLTGAARLFANQFWNYGGERYWVQFSDDQYSTNFFYDTWVYIGGDSSGMANLEFDMNQTMSNGETVIMGFQCDTWNNTWDYSANGGSPDNSWATWGHSGQHCNVHDWSPNQWHHLQIWFSHDSSGWVTYHAVWFDGAEQDINVTAFSGFNLGWGPAVVTNFQLDGNNGNTSWGNVYLDEMTVSRW